MKTVTTILTGWFFFATGLAMAVSPEDILQKADEIRNPSDSYYMQVKVESAHSDDPTSVFQVSLQGNSHTLVRTVEPARDRGRNLLMLDEDMWAFIPNLRRAVRVSLSQKLTGQAANGDISRMRWAGDYDVTIEKESAKDWTLFLKAKKKGLTYDQVRVWIEKGSYRPLKADFLSLGGKVLKRAVYEGYRPMAGKVRPTQIQIRDATRDADRSTITIEKMVVKKFPSAIFQQTNLSRTE